MAVSTKLNKDVFGVEVTNHELLGRAYRAYLANNRSAAAKTKKRGEVRGGGRKPWAQKGTGRARIGSIRAPHWRGGGVTFGPNGEQNFKLTIPKAAKKVAIKQALSLQNREGLIQTFAPSTLKLKDGKTKQGLEFISKNKAINLNFVLIVVNSKDDMAVRGFANIPNVKYVSAPFLNVYDVLNADLILVSEDSLPTIESWLTSKASRVGSKTAEAKILTIKTGEAKKPTKTNTRKVSVEELKVKATANSDVNSQSKGGAK